MTNNWSFIIRCLYVCVFQHFVVAAADIIETKMKLN